MVDTTLSAAGSARLGPWERLVARLARRLACGTLTLVFSSGARLHVSGAAPGPEATVHFHHPRAARRLLLRGDQGFAEAYLDGDCWSPDLAALADLAARNDAALDAALQAVPGLRLLRRVGHAMRANTRRGSRRNILAHYDLGNAFYERWLDPSLTYSAALFETGRESLEAAQALKYRRICDTIGLTGEHHLLEIGCGWGGFALHAARERGARVTALTISDAQYAMARRRVFEAGLAEKVEVRLQDYRDCEGSFDRIASIEMFEAVGERYWTTFFDVLRRRLAAGGVAALQVITIDDARFRGYRRNPDFIQRYIFPGGMLPSRAALARLAQGAGFAWRDEHAFGRDYARTLGTWRDRFLGAWPEIESLGFDERFRRLWEFYLAYCEGGFRAGAIDVRQIALARG